MEIIDIIQIVCWIIVFIVDFISFVICKNTPSIGAVLFPVLGCIVLSISLIIAKY